MSAVAGDTAVPAHEKSVQVPSTPERKGSSEATQTAPALLRPRPDKHSRRELLSPLQTHTPPDSTLSCCATLPSVMRTLKGLALPYRGPCGRAALLNGRPRSAFAHRIVTDAAGGAARSLSVSTTVFQALTQPRAPGTGRG